MDRDGNDHGDRGWPQTTSPKQAGRAISQQNALHRDHVPRGREGCGRQSDTRGPVPPGPRAPRFPHSPARAPQLMPPSPYPLAPMPPGLSLDVDEVPEMILHAHQLAIVNGVGGVYQRDLFLVHFANIKILEKSEKLFRACRREAACEHAAGRLSSCAPDAQRAEDMTKVSEMSTRSVRRPGAIPKVSQLRKGPSGDARRAERAGAGNSFLGTSASVGPRAGVQLCLTDSGPHVRSSPLLQSLVTVTTREH